LKHHKKFILGYVFVLLSILLVGEKLSFIQLRSSVILANLVFVCTLAFSHLLILQTRLRFKRVVSAVLTTLALITPLVSIGFYGVFRASLNDEVFFAIYQSNFDESAEYLSDFIPFGWIAGGVLVILLAVVFHLRQKDIDLSGTERRNALIALAVCIGLTLVMTHRLRLVTMPVVTAKTYYDELKEFQRLRQLRASGQLNLEVQRLQDPGTHIVFIGESLNKNHMSVYGYPRETTPKLDSMAKDDSIHVLKKAYSIHTHTMHVLRLALTEANQVNKKDHFKSPSIINVLNKAGADTFWITNQNLIGGWDNIVSIIAQDATQVIALNNSVGKVTDTSRYDGAILEHLEKILQTPADNPRVIFVHVMGNHGKYCKRFPAEFRKFEESPGTDQFGRFSEKISSLKRLNCYDNSVYYGDHVVTETLKLLESIDGANSFFYFADHADDVLRDLGHNTSKFTFDMVQIPLIFWFSDEYRDKFPQKIDNISRDNLFSNDFIYDTILGILDVETPHYDPSADLTSKSYGRSQKKYMTLGGRLNYKSKKNEFWLKVSNARYLEKNDLQKRVFAHRVNSTGKLRDLWVNGLRSFEVDVFYRKKGNFFEVGHGKGEMGTTLEKFLAEVEPQEIQRLWLDFKNLGAKNHKAAIRRLNQLDRLYGIKNVTLVESNTKDQFFKHVKLDGWQTSYYLPTRLTTDLIESKDNKGMEKLAAKISRQIEAQMTDSVSFDEKLYSFVKDHLEKRISPEVRYHSWMGPKFIDRKFAKKLEANKLFKDKRVESILVEYQSRFTL